jgi:diguanylate cyclase
MTVVGRGARRDAGSDEGRRAGALARLAVLEDLPPASLQRLTRIAAHLAGGQGVCAAVHLLDDAFQHRVAATGAPRERSDVRTSLCTHPVEADRPLHLPDPATDPRFVGNPWTTGPDALHLYYGVPLRLSGRGGVGTLCVFSGERRTLDAGQRARLRDLADVVSDQLELLALARQLGHDAAHDPLTGLPNRAVLGHRLSAALARRGRDGSRPVLLLVDLDGFEGVNDRHGHGTGDDVLVSTAERLRSAVRAGDVVARLGGDEFAVLLEGDSGDDDVRDVVRRLRAVAAEPHPTREGPVVCGFSTGVGRAQDGDLPYELLGRADADLYVGKHVGRTVPRQG